MSIFLDGLPSRSKRKGKTGREYSDFYPLKKILICPAIFDRQVVLVFRHIFVVWKFKKKLNMCSTVYVEH